MGRQEYRASQVISNKLFKAAYNGDVSIESSIGYSKMESDADSMSEFDDNPSSVAPSNKIGETGKRYVPYSLDPTIESKKLDKKKVNELNRRQRLIYDK